MKIEGGDWKWIEIKKFSDVSGVKEILQEGLIHTQISGFFPRVSDKTWTV